jgi:hypothetical protein
MVKPGQPLQEGVVKQDWCFKSFTINNHLYKILSIENIRSLELTLNYTQKYVLLINLKEGKVSSEKINQ